MYFKNSFKHIMPITLCLALAISFSFTMLLQAGHKKKIRKYYRSHTELEQLQDLVQEPGFRAIFITGALLKKFKSLVNLRDSNGFALLDYARTAESRRFLLKLGARSSEKEALTHTTSLQEAAIKLAEFTEGSEDYKKQLNTVRTIIFNGERIDLSNSEEITLVQRAFFNGLVGACLTGDVEQALKQLRSFKSKAKRQAYINKRFCGFTPLEAGLSQENHSIVELLLHYGAQLDSLPNQSNVQVAKPKLARKPMLTCNFMKQAEKLDLAS